GHPAGRGRREGVSGMLPKKRLGRPMIQKLPIVAGPAHPPAAHTAPPAPGGPPAPHQPLPLAVGERPAWGGLPVTAPTTIAPASEPKRRRPTAEPAPKPAAPPAGG